MRGAFGFNNAGQIKESFIAPFRAESSFCALVNDARMKSRQNVVSWLNIMKSEQRAELNELPVCPCRVRPGLSQQEILEHQSPLATRQPEAGRDEEDYLEGGEKNLVLLRQRRPVLQGSRNPSVTRPIATCLSRLIAEVKLRDRSWRYACAII